MVLIKFWTLQLENGAQEHILEELHHHRSTCYESWLERSTWMHLLLFTRQEELLGLKCQLFSSISVIAEQGAVQSGIFVTNIMSSIAIVSFASKKHKVDVGVSAVGSIVSDIASRRENKRDPTNYGFFNTKSS